MKNKPFICLTVLILLVSIAFIGCDNEGGGEDTQALTENDFANDAGLRADPEKHLIVKFLEHPDSDRPENDTGEVGNDTIPHTYTRTVENTFCWDDEDGEAGHFMELDDSQGNEIFRLDANGECVTVVLEAGDYVMHIHHDGRIETTHSIFIVPERNGDLGAKKEETIPEGIVGRAGRVLSNILEKLDISITQTTYAQTDNPGINTFISTDSCVTCDLTGADMAGADGFELDLREAILNGVNLTLANLARAKLDGATFTDANFTGTNLVGADLTGAIWCDGSICLEGSTGTCETGTRYIFNCDRTVMDMDTGLMWEKKDSPGGGVSVCPGGPTCDNPHDVNNRYALTDGVDGELIDPDGSAFTDFLERLNNSCNNDPTVDCTVGGDADCMNAGVVDCCGYACFRDWRLPELGLDGGAPELESILDIGVGGCGGGNGACIDPIFGSTAQGDYGSATPGEVGMPGDDGGTGGDGGDGGFLGGDGGTGGDSGTVGIGDFNAGSLNFGTGNVGADNSGGNGGNTGDLNTGLINTRAVRP